MMQSIDVRRLNAEKKYAGDLSFEFEPEADLVQIPYVSFSSPAEAKIHFEILEDDSVEVTGLVSFRLKGACSRCLKETERRFERKVKGYFVPDGDGREDYSYRNGVVELGEFLRDSVAFSLPGVLHCELCEDQEENE